MAYVFSVLPSYTKELIFQVSVPSSEYLLKRTARKKSISVILCRKNGNVKHGVKFWKRDVMLFQLYLKFFFGLLSLSFCNIRN
jgi:hypothetical protein